MAEKYGYAQSLCTHPWVLFVDADEWLNPAIKGEIEEVLGAETDYDGFMVRRKNFYLGRVIEHGGWYPDHEIRLYRKEMRPLARGHSCESTRRGQGGPSEKLLPARAL